MTKKPRRILITLEVDTTLTVAEIRKADRIAIGSSMGVESVWIYRHPMSMEHHLLQVQANAVKPAPVKAKAKRGRKA